MVINNFSIESYDDSYTAPELLTPRLHGDVIGHPRLGDTDIITSVIVGKRNGKVVTASGSEYELGTVDPKWEDIYPNAKERFLSTLEEIPPIGEPETTVN